MDRRGLGYDQASVLSHSVHTRWISTLVQHKHRVPPPDYKPVTWQQLHTADAELFMLAAQEARQGVRPDIRGVKPLDAIFEWLMVDSRVTFFLMPRPIGTTSSGAAASRDSPATADNHSHGRGRKRELPQQQQQQNPKKSSGKGKSQKKGGGKDGKSKSRGKGTYASDGSLATTRSGKRLCSDFNGSGCRAGVQNSGLYECSKGVHLCNAPKCIARGTHGRAGHTAAHE